MKAVLLYNRVDGSFAMVEHNLEERDAESLVIDYSKRGKEAYVVPQAGEHSGKSTGCIRCQVLGMEYVTRNRLEAGAKPGQLAMSGALGMISEGLSPARPSSRKRKVRLFTLVPLLVAGLLAWMGYLVSTGEMDALLNRESLDAVNEAASIQEFQTPVPAAALPMPTATPLSVPSSTPRATRTPLPTSTSTPTVVPTEKDPDGCILPEEVTAEDAGRTMCVAGLVTRVYEQGGAFFILFSEDREVFQLLSYDWAWGEARPGVCVRASGEIKLLGKRPVIVFGYHSDIQICP